MRKRIIYANRQVLANDVNVLTEYFENDLIIYSRDVLGVSDGIASGLTLDSFTTLDIIINLGTAFSNGKFYELLEDDTLTLPSVDGVYKIYATKTVTEDTPVSGFVLLDTTTRQESYDTVNTRRYDSLTLGYTLGTIPTNSFLLGEATVSGGVITSYDDQRTLTSIGNLASNSIQAFSETARNVGASAGEITGYVFDQTDPYKPFIKVAIDNSFVGKAISINNGSSAGTQGIYNLVNGNIGYYTTFSGTNGIGSYSELSGNNIGFSAYAGTSSSTIGFKAEGLDRGSYLKNNVIGLRIDNNNTSVKAIEINGYGVADVGIDVIGGFEAYKSLNSKRGYVFNYSSIPTITSPTDAIAGQYISLDGGNSSTVLNYGSVININGNNKVGQSITLIPNTTSSLLYGINITNNTTESTATIGINVGGDTAKIARGVNVTNSTVGIGLLSNDIGLLSTPSDNQVAIEIDGDGNDGVIGIELLNVKEPIKIINNASSTASSLFSIEGHATVLSNTPIGINITKVQTAINLYDLAFGINIEGIQNKGIIIDSSYANSNAQKGIDITLSNNNSNTTYNEGMRITLNGSNKYGQNIQMIPSSSSASLVGTNIQSNANNNSNIGISIDNIGYGIIVNNSENPINITNATNTSSAININGSGVNNTDKGISLANLKEAISITDSRNGYLFTNNSLLSPSNASQQTFGSKIILSGGNASTAYPNVGQYIGLNSNNRVGQFIDLDTTSNSNTLVGIQITNTNATAQSNNVVGAIIGGKNSSYKFGAGLIISDSKIGISLDSSVEVPFKVPVLSSSDPLPSSPTLGYAVFKVVDSLTYELHVYGGTNWLVHA